MFQALDYSQIRGKTIFLTGAAGFVGANLLRRLIDLECQVHIPLKSDSKTWRIDELLKHPLVKTHELDLSNLKKLTFTLKKTKPQIIYHLAARGAYSHQNQLLDIMQGNIVATWNLFQAVQDFDYELLVNTGSSSEYGFKDHPMFEADVLEPNSYYAVSKVANSLLGSYLAQAQQQPIVTLRLFSVYGPYEEPTRFFPTLMKALYKSLPLNLTSPQTARDFIYVDDVVDVYIQVNALKKKVGACFNVGTGQQSTLGEVVELAQKISGRKVDVKVGAFPAKSWDSSTWVADMKRTEHDLSWSAEHSLEAGITKMWQWFKKNHHLYE